MQYNFLFTIFLYESYLYIPSNKPISSELCSILILPESGKDLIDNKYHKFINKINKKTNIYDKKFILTKNNIEFILEEFNKYYYSLDVS